MKILHIGPVKNTNTVLSGGADYEILPGLGVDGPSRSILGLAHGLAAAGIESGVLSTKPFRAPSQELSPVTFLTPYTGRKHNFLIRVRKWIDQIETEFGCPDLVNFHDVYDIFSVAIASGIRKRGWRYIVTPRGGLRRVAQKRDNYKKKIANPLFFKQYLRKALFINALAEGEAAEIPLFDSKLKTVIIPNGLSSEILSLSQKLPKLSKKSGKKIVVGFLGQIFVEIKGIDILLEAVKHLQKRGEGDNLIFVLVGPIPTASDREWVKRMIRNLPNPEQVVWMGPKLGQEKWEVLNSFDVFVLPSRTEGMPVVGLEAMAFGKPCLFSKASNMADIIQQAQGGWSGGETSEDIYEKLVDVSHLSRERLQELGQNAQAYVARHLTWDSVVTQYLQVIREYV